MSLKALKQRISAIKSTKQITKAMQMVAASKLRRAREDAEQSKEYSNLMSNIVKDVVSSLNKESDDRSLLFGTKIVKKIMMVVIASDRGLCGSYNSSVLKFADKVISNHIHNKKDIIIFTVGRKSEDYLKKRYPQSIVKSAHHVTGKIVDFAVSCDLAKYIIEEFEAGSFDKCEVIYSHFYSVITQKPTLQTLIPASCGAPLERNVNGEFTFDPSRNEILDTLIPENIKIQFHHALIEGNASEHASRMTAMDNATNNCGDLIGSLQILYNRTRQAQITKELVEIISGAEAV